MSTRCHIQVQDSNGKLFPCMIYKHSDGYPEGVLPFLKEFSLAFVKDRGDDAEYFIAQLLRHWAFADQDKDEKDPWYIANPKSQTMNRFTGWGICLTSAPHGDTEYMYTVDLKDGSIKVS